MVALLLGAVLMSRTDKKEWKIAGLEPNKFNKSFFNISLSEKILHFYHQA